MEGVFLTPSPSLGVFCPPRKSWDLRGRAWRELKVEAESADDMDLGSRHIFWNSRSTCFVTLGTLNPSRPAFRSLYNGDNNQHFV